MKQLEKKIRTLRALAERVNKTRRAAVEEEIDRLETKYLMQCAREEVAKTKSKQP